MKYKILAFIILGTASMQSVAEYAYWVDSNGDYVRDRNGHCVRTINWTPELAIPGCEGKEEVAAKPAPAPVVKAAPVVAAPVATEPVYTNISLASGATFEHGGSTLSAEGKAEVKKLVEQFRGKSVDSVIIEGHTDSTGDAAFNQQLSEKRAEAVKAEAVANGANPDKITTVGYGETKPIADNSTREGRAKNRRVEIRVKAKQAQ
ncbi:MAG: OmpA family protein [Gammaproteobacteria bacterium]|nr:OmpA family protein [Gammaproteobacteria bacterium]